MILVTGGTGFLGAVLIEKLLAKGNTVRAIKRSSATIPTALKDRAQLEWVDVDLLDIESLADTFAQIDQVYHAAAMVSFAPKDKQKILNFNIQGTANLVNLCLENQIPLMHVSSVAALGLSKKGELITENHFLEYDPQIHDYGLSKYESEMEVWRGIAEGLEAIIVNPSVIIGSSAGTKGSGAIFKLVQDGLQFYTAGATGLVDVDDVATCMIQLMEQACYGERFILSAENISYQDLFQEIAKNLNIPGPQKKASPWILGLAWRVSQFVSYWTGTSPGLTKHTARSSFNRSFYSNQKVIDQLGFQFKPLKESIREVSLSLLKRS